jgi:hypothetical protein
MKGTYLKSGAGRRVGIGRPFFVCGVRVKAAEFRNKRDVGVFFRYAFFKYKWHGRWNAEHA